MKKEKKKINGAYEFLKAYLREFIFFFILGFLHSPTNITEENTCITTSCY